MPLSPARFVPGANLLLLPVLTRSATMPTTIVVARISCRGRITQLITDDFRWTGRFLSDHGQVDPRGKQFLCDGVIRMLLIIRFLGEIEANVIGSRY